MDEDDKDLRLSIVAPCYNEELGLAEFAARMIAAAEARVGSAYELILVNDGSRDATWARIHELAQQHPAVRGVNLARNHGHQLAVTAGLALTRGARIMVIDADLQDPPELLGEMMARMEDGFDVVYGQRRKRANESVFKRASAHVFYRFLAKLSDVSIPNDTGDFRLMSRRIVDRLNAMPEQDRFLRGMVAWLGGRQTEVLYDRDARYAGETGYTLGKMMKLAVNGLTGFSTAPLRLALVLAFVGVLIALGIAIYAVVGFFIGHVAPGWTSLALILSFFGVAQLTCIGLMGSYLGRVYMQVKGRPLYMIDEVVSHGRSDAPPAKGRTP